MVLGLFGLYLGISFWGGVEPMPAHGGGCRAICGFTMIMFELFGETIGRLFAGGLWSVVGLGLFILGYRLRLD